MWASTRTWDPEGIVSTLPAIATHDPDMIAALGRRTLVLEDGRLRSLTTTAEATG